MLVSGVLTLAGAKLNGVLLDVLLNHSRQPVQHERQQADSTGPVLA